AQGEAHTQQDQPEDHLRVLSAAKVLADAARKKRKFTAEESVSTAGVSMQVSSTGMVQEASTPGSVATKDKGKAIMIQAKEREKYSKAKKARLLAKLINQRKKDFAQQRAEERRNKPLTQAQQRTYMCNYIKHMGSHTLQQLKRLSYDELKALFETTIKRVQNFHPIESEDDKTVPELTTGNSKRAAEVELDHEGSKKHKTNEASGLVQEHPEEEET
ncbi:hypothetical protein Tco_0546237, partial [Tanacetum coccineum]